MKFSEARLRETFERSALKLSVICLSIISLVFSILLGLDLSKEAIVIERACEASVLRVASSAQTKEEIDSFVRAAVAARFDSTVSHDPSAYMLQDLVVARSKEQDELKRSGVDQRMIVRKVLFNDGNTIVDADRVVAVGKARSAIPIVLSAVVSSKNRSLSNPYGLVLTSIEQKKVEATNAH